MIAKSYGRGPAIGTDLDLGTCRIRLRIRPFLEPPFHIQRRGGRDPVIRDVIAPPATARVGPREMTSEIRAGVERRNFVER